MFYEGRGVAQSDVEAARWYRKAADQGHADEHYNLGFMFVHGRGVAQSDVEAARRWQKAADQGIAGAQSNLGLMFVQGRGVAQSEVEAARWCRKAADQGHRMRSVNWYSPHTQDAAAPPKRVVVGRTVAQRLRPRPFLTLVSKKQVQPSSGYRQEGAFGSILPNAL
jgi:TPR repeat protein